MAGRNATGFYDYRGDVPVSHKVIYWLKSCAFVDPNGLSGEFNAISDSLCYHREAVGIITAGPRSFLAKRMKAF